MREVGSEVAVRLTTAEGWPLPKGQSGLGSPTGWRSHGDAFGLLCPRSMSSGAEDGLRAAAALVAAAQPAQPAGTQDTRTVSWSSFRGEEGSRVTPQWEEV